MKKPEKELGYYMGWFIAYLMAAGFTLYFLWLGKPVSWCSGADDEHCFREWFSAFGGWLAAAVTAATVIYLARQIEEERSHNRRTILVELQRQIFSIERMVIKIDEIRSIHKAAKNFFNDSMSEVEAKVAFPQIVSFLKNASDEINSDFFSISINEYVKLRNNEINIYRNQVERRSNELYAIKGIVQRDKHMRICVSVMEQFEIIEDILNRIEEAAIEERKRLDSIFTS